MQLEIVSPEEQLFSGEVNSIQFPGKEGSFGVWENHAPLIAALIEGEITFVLLDQKPQSITIKGGVVEVLKNKVLVLAD